MKRVIYDIMWKLKTYLKPYWQATVLAPLFMLLEVAMDLLQPWLMASMINEGVMKGDFSHLQDTGLLMLAAALIGLLGGFGCTVYSSQASLFFASDVREDLFRKIQALTFHQLDQFKEGSLITRLTGDIIQIQNLVQLFLRALVRAPLLAVGSIVMAMTLNFSLTLILLGVTPVIILVLYYLMRFSSPLFAVVQRKLDQINIILQENLKGIRVIKAFVRADHEKKRFEQANQEYTENAVKATRVISLNMPLMMLILNWSIVAILWLGANQTWSGIMQLGDLVAFIQYVTQLLFSLMMATRVMMSVPKARVSAQRIQELLYMEPGLTTVKEEKDEIIRAGEVEFEEVSFGYGNRQNEILTGLNLKVEPGRTIAILGATGSGKSTLVSLIPRLYDPASGRIKIDGVDVKEIPLHQLRSKIGMVLQESILFSGTIRENICYGKPHATLAEVEAAAKAAQAHEFILSLPDGYDTLVGQRGTKLSGGQKQRISIARALLVRPVILILDDCTSAVDMNTEARLRQALREQMSGCTTFLIAHRISSIMEADRIILLKEGKFIAEGTHADLMRSSPIYRDLYHSQLYEEEERVYG